MTKAHNLLDECLVDHHRDGGVKLTHIPTGIEVIVRDHPVYTLNRDAAFALMADTLNRQRNLSG